MKSFIAERNHDLAPADIPLDIERECQTWDWVRAAGVSAEDLRKALRDYQQPTEAGGR